MMFVFYFFINKLYNYFPPFTVDTVPPFIVGCPADITVTSPAGQMMAVVTWTPPSAVDDSGVIAAMFNNFNPGDVFPLGTNEVIYTWVDPSGNVASCTFSVNVVLGKWV